MSIVEAIIQIVAPFTCIGCGAEEDRKLCEACTESLTPVSSRCYRCGRASDMSQTCAACQPSTLLEAVTACVEYADLSKQLVRDMKYERAQAVSKEIAMIMAQTARHISQEVLYVPVPTATSRVRKRGYDHAMLLAREIARLQNASWAPLLRRHGQTRQVGATKLERAKQLKGAFRVIHPEKATDCHIVLVDDVLTTGSTLESAAQVLRAYGATRVDALVFAQGSRILSSELL
jgi:ComF family protein